MRPKISGQDLSTLKNSFVLSINGYRLNLMNRVFRASGLPSPEAIAGEERGKVGCCLGHKKIIDTASARGLPWCMSFEDDAYPCLRIRRKLKTLVLPDADVYLLGYSTTNCKFGNGEEWAIMKPGDRCCGTHAILIRGTAYDVMSSTLGRIYHADDVFRIMSNGSTGLSVAVKRSPLFIQYNQGDLSALHGHRGYIFNGDHGLPPKGFPHLGALLQRMQDKNHEHRPHR